MLRNSRVRACAFSLFGSRCFDARGNSSAAVENPGREPLAHLPENSPTPSGFRHRLRPHYRSHRIRWWENAVDHSLLTHFHAFAAKTRRHADPAIDSLRSIGYMPFFRHVSPEIIDVWWWVRWEQVIKSISACVGFSAELLQLPCRGQEIFFIFLWILIKRLVQIFLFC